MPRRILRSGAAERTERFRQRRSSSSGEHPGGIPRLRVVAPLAGIALALAGCAADGGTPAPTTPTSAAAAAEERPDPALAAACAEFWGDPDYTEPVSREVLDRAGSAAEIGPSDPGFYAMTGDDVERVFEGAPEEARGAAGILADWFRSEPERGADADLDAFAAAWEGVAGACQGVSTAALWAAGAGEDGTKPAALVCADVFDTPGTLTHFANSNVLTSNMFKLVGLSPREVPTGSTTELRATAELLDAQIAAVDDEAVAAALEQVRAPFADALDGDTWSDGLQAPLDQLSAACADQSYHAPAPDQEGGDAVVGASDLVPGDRPVSLPVLPNGAPA